MPDSSTSRDLTDADVRRIADLARLTLSDDEVVRTRERLSEVLVYMDRLRELDLAGVEPMTSVAAEFNRLDDDEIGPTLSVEALRSIAPAMEGRFVRIPKVIDDGEGS
jgi:aspartyl-tRNA(Asn)/glutamyl-tRNA(Gln) amidotransferase subunit C